ncbi:MAG: TRAP transporter small permease [Paracoccaceae bacterium]|nr:MAG: TRAP transporter small permease [Paracoccaceae bacterium]
MSQPPRAEESGADLAHQVDAASRAIDVFDHDAGKGRIDRAVNKAAEVAGVAVLLSIVLLVFGNAVSRYIVGRALIWSDELVLAMLPWLGMLGMFLSIRRRQIIRIDFLSTRLSDGPRRVLGYLTELLAAGAFLWLAVAGFQYVQFFGTDRTIYLQIQKGWFQAALMIGPLLAALAYVMLVVEDMRGGGRSRR